MIYYHIFSKALIYKAGANEIKGWSIFKFEIRQQIRSFYRTFQIFGFDQPLISFAPALHYEGQPFTLFILHCISSIALQTIRIPSPHGIQASRILWPSADNDRSSSYRRSARVFGAPPICNTCGVLVCNHGGPIQPSHVSTTIEDPPFMHGSDLCLSGHRRTRPKPVWCMIFGAGGGQVLLVEVDLSFDFANNASTAS